MWSWCSLRNFYADPWEATLDVHKKLGLPLKPPYSETLKHGKYLEKQLCEQGAGYWERFVAGVYGPVVVDFLSWIAHTVKKEGEAPVYFLSRDGYVFYKVLEGVGDDSAHYVYANRLLFEMMYHAVSDDIESYLSVFLNRFERYSEARERLIHLKRMLPPPLYEIYREMGAISCWEFRDITQNNWDLIRREFKLQLDMFGNYIAPLIHERIFIVDLIAKGGTQYWLERILKTLGVNIKMIGLYFRQYPLTSWARKLVTYSYVPGGNLSVAPLLISNNQMMLELMFSAPHGKFMGFDKDGKSVFLPSRRGSKYEEFIKKTNEYFSEFVGGIPLEGTGSALNLLLSFLQYPTLEDIKQFGTLTLEAGAHEKEVRVVDSDKNGHLQSEVWPGVVSYRGMPVSGAGNLRSLFRAFFREMVTGALSLARHVRNKC